MDVNEERRFLVNLLLGVDEVELVSLLGGVLFVLDVEFAFRAQRCKNRCCGWVLLGIVCSRVTRLRGVPIASPGRLSKHDLHFRVGKNAVSVSVGARKPLENLPANGRLFRVRYDTVFVSVDLREELENLLLDRIIRVCACHKSQ